MRTLHQADPEFKYSELSSVARQGVIDLLKKRLSEDLGIVLAYVHGGFLDGGPFRDMDLALWLKDEKDAWSYMIDLSAELEVEIGAPVDIQVLNKAPLPFMHEVLTRGRILISNDEGFRTRLLDVTIRQYMDLIQTNRLSSRGRVELQTLRS